MTTKSIIGCKYVANGMKAIDLNLRQEVALGMNHKYTIIADPYVCEYYRPAPLDFSPRKVKMMAVNVLDDRTGLTYAVEYHPANLVCEDRTTNQPETPVDFTAAVSVVEILGVEQLVTASVNGQEFTAKIDVEVPVKTGSTIGFTINKHKIHIFDKETERNISLK